VENIFTKNLNLGCRKYPRYEPFAVSKAALEIESRMREDKVLKNGVRDLISNFEACPQNTGFYLMKRLTTMTNKEIGDLFGIGYIQSVRYIVEWKKKWEKKRSKKKSRDPNVTCQGLSPKKRKRINVI
jgi:hypothetical protein